MSRLLGMTSTSSFRTSISIFTLLLLSLLLCSDVFAALNGELSRENRTLWVEEEVQKLRVIRSHLKRINKPAVRIIESSHGEIIDCVLFHHQPAFDHPLLMGHRPMEPPERPRSHDESGMVIENFQLWKESGKSCPQGTVPIRRTMEDDVLRAGSFRRFGRKIKKYFRREDSNDGHEHAIGYVTGDQYYGAKANINVWAPEVANPDEFSLSQIWVISGSFGNDLNTIEAGWQVSPELYGDNYPRFFTYWTNDAYQTSGCYNLLCSGFIQTDSRIALGAAISPTSSYNGGQFDISLLIWKDPKHGNWWLEFGPGILVGYWPSILFTHLRDQASMIQFGGEVVNSSPSGLHTATQMGSGHFPGEGFGKASYFRNLQVVDFDNNMVPVSSLRVLADKPNCYNIQGGSNDVWGNYFYYGGPGKNVVCP